ncbi:alpha/beta hydrolase [Streptomyces olivoreticuli]|uniref:alpha/beta hydrolase n=1 Tax=Streptomyces olivoreticuli TaxID=68246 RepID=UPI001F07ADE0|nr:alpha/beta hydrolase [Streptomyces olivoreticuli]
MDYTALSSLNPSEYEDAADGYRTTSDMAGQAKDSLENQTTANMRKSLKGEAADAALGQLRELAKDFHYMQVECGLIGTALDAFASDMRAAKKKLDAAVEDARAKKFTVGADGSIGYPAAGEKTDGKAPQGGTAKGATDETARAINRQAANFDPNPNYAYAQECADRIAEALKQATEADEKWAPKLRSLKADDDLTVSDSDWADAQQDMGGVRQGAKDYLDHIKPPPKEGDPEANAAWWKELSKQEKADYISVHPATIGALDGLPADARDEANRIVLDEKRGQYGARLAEIPKEPTKFVDIRHAVPGMAYTGEWLAWNKKYGPEVGRLKNALTGMDAIQNRFDSTGGVQGLPEAYLLGFDPEGKGDGKIIIANGNPDTADHTAVYVPGTGTDLGGIEGNIGRSEKLWRESHRVAPGDKVSTITWFDYDAPRSAYPGDKGDILPEAMSDQYAEKAGPVLRQFLDGNRAAHQNATGDAAHTTVIGHSYGSTVIGDAAKSGSFQDSPMAADDVVVAGSPGMQAKRAADLGIDPHHMWAMKGGGSDNFVREGGRLVGLGDDWTIPTDKSFGANVMKSDAKDHGGFWDENGEKASVSLKNQARVIVGRYGDVTLEE